MSGLNNATQDFTGSNVFEFPNPASPFTHHQQYALEALRQGRSVTAIMEELRYERQTFYDWRNNNAAFRLATEEARDDFRGVVADCVHDLQQAVHVLLDDCIRTERVPLPLRLRSAALFLRYAHSETLLPRRLVAMATAPDGISPSSPNTGPASPTPFPNQNPEPSEPEAPEPQASDASDSPEPATQTPEASAAPEFLQPQKTGETVRSVRLESANSATKSCRHGQSESASDARGSQSNIIQAPTAAAQIPNPSETTPPPASAPKLQASEPHASAATEAPHPEPTTQQATLSQTWLSHTFLHKHENPKAFDKLLANHIGTYQPATAPEELLVFRITQKTWLLRRVETWERVIADSRVAKVREKHPNAAAPACIAMALLERRETNQTRFYERTAKLRKEYEDALDRLTTRLETLQARRHASDLRAQRNNPFSANHPVHATPARVRLSS